MVVTAVENEAERGNTLRTTFTALPILGDRQVGPRRTSEAEQREGRKDQKCDQQQAKRAANRAAQEEAVATIACIEKR